MREISEACSRCVAAWMEARAADDFGAYATPLGARRGAEATRGRGDRGRRRALRRAARRLRAGRDDGGARAGLRRPARAADAAGGRGRRGRADAGCPSRTWSEAGQMAIAREIAEMMGFDLVYGLIARSAHPFTGGSTSATSASPPGSTRRARSATSPPSCTSWGTPSTSRASPPRPTARRSFDAPSLGAARVAVAPLGEPDRPHRGLLGARLEPRHAAALPRGARPASTPPPARAGQRASSPALIRVEADEVTYNLHIILRFELELALLDGRARRSADLPGRLRGRHVRTYSASARRATRTACMQDIHWADGLFGYFPTYTLGNLYSAQLAEAAQADLGRASRRSSRRAASRRSSGSCATASIATAPRCRPAS